MWLIAREDEVFLHMGEDGGDAIDKRRIVEAPAVGLEEREGMKCWQECIVSDQADGSRIKGYKPRPRRKGLESSSRSHYNHGDPDRPRCLVRNY